MSRTWPLPALASWALGWAVFLGLRQLAAPLAIAIVTAVGLGAALSLLGRSSWRKLLIAAGFPISLAASGAASTLPAWAWLLPLAVLAAVYPLNAWRDAPLFPTPARALSGLPAVAPLAAGAAVLDAGCGLGAGLAELRRAYPRASLHGLEWSWPLRVLCAWRCRFARVRRRDIWVADWSPYALVYLFQRPESMDRAAEKASRELRHGAWLASLEFEAPGFVPTRVLACPDGRRLWLYQLPFNTLGEAAESGLGRALPHLL